MDEINRQAEHKLPSQMELSEHFWSSLWHDETFDVKGKNGENLGKIERDYWAATPTFDYYDAAGKLQAHGRTEIFSWGTTNDIDDAQGHRIGTFKKEVLKSMLGLGVTNRYSVLDANGNEIANSDKSQFWSTDINIQDKSGQNLATAHRGAFNWFGDTWSVTVNKPELLDPRMAIMLGAFKTAGDNKSSDSASSNKTTSKKK